MNLSKYEKSLILVLFIVIIYASFFFYNDFKIREDIHIKEVNEEVRLKNLEKDINSLYIEAKAYSIYDITAQKKLYGYNDTWPLPLASLVKTMSILVSESNKNVNKIIISSSALKQDGDYGLLAGEKWNKQDLEKFTLIFSSNDGAYALSETDPEFLNKMNNKAQRLGLLNTNFNNVTGLDIDDHIYGAVGTAEEMNQLAYFALLAQPDIFSFTTQKEMTFTSESNFTHKAINTNTIIDKIPNLLFSKTGATDLTGGNLSIIFINKGGHNIAITVLGSSITGRFTDMEKLASILYNLNNEI